MSLTTRSFNSDINLNRSFPGKTFLKVRRHCLRILDSKNNEEKEIEIISKKISASSEDKILIKSMVQMANLTRKGFEQKDISIVMSPRTVIMWAENYKLLNNLQTSLSLTFLNKCDESEIDIYNEYFQRTFGLEL